MLLETGYDGDCFFRKKLDHLFFFSAMSLGGGGLADLRGFFQP